MNIEQVNATLTTAIEQFQAGELEILWEFMVPSPHEMHRKTGMRLPTDQFVVPTPAQVMGRSQKTSKPKVVKPKKISEPKEVNQDKAQAGAAKSNDQFNRIFEKLKPRQVIWLLFNSSISRGKEYVPFTVGRRSHSKKYNYTRLTLFYKGQKSPGPIGIQPNLYRRNGDDVMFALGDLATTLRGIYVPKS